MNYLNVIPVSQAANINAGESSKINLGKIILINSFPSFHPLHQASYTQFSLICSQNWIFFTQLQGVCAQVLSKKIVAPNFGHVLLHTEWTFGRFRIFTDAITVNLLAPKPGCVRVSLDDPKMKKNENGLESARRAGKTRNERLTKEDQQDLPEAGPEHHDLWQGSSPG